MENINISVIKGKLIESNIPGYFYYPEKDCMVSSYKIENNNSTKYLIDGQEYFYRRNNKDENCNFNYEKKNKLIDTNIDGYFYYPEKDCMVSVYNWGKENDQKYLIDGQEYYYRRNNLDEQCILISKEKKQDKKIKINKEIDKLKNIIKTMIQNKEIELLKTLEPFEANLTASDYHKYIYNFLGARYQKNFTSTIPYEETKNKNNNDKIFVSLKEPGINEEYLEYIDLIESVHHSKNKFTMMELGAGFGRWGINAICAIKKLKKNIPYYVTFIEAEPAHFQMLKQSIIDNDINKNNVRLIEGAVSDKDGQIYFYVGDPVAWYGQSICPENAKVENKALVNCYSLSTLLKDQEFWDILDLDVQGEEYKVLSSCIGELRKKVRKIHIGTHGYEIENNLKILFKDWINIWEYSLYKLYDTPVGKIKFGDGVFTYINPDFI